LSSFEAASSLLFAPIQFFFAEPVVVCGTLPVSRFHGDGAGNWIAATRKEFEEGRSLFRLVIKAPIMKHPEGGRTASDLYLEDHFDITIRELLVGI
jgi:hypothetical protein